MDKVPALNAKGLFTVTAPYSLVSGTIYTCIAVTKIKALLAVDVDVLALYYVPYGLTDVEYGLDVNEDMSIVTLMPDGETVPVYIPSRYLDNVPIVDVVPYSRIILSADLGAIPDALSLETTKATMSDILSDITGVNTDIDLHRIKVEGYVSYSEHAILEGNRLSSIVHRTTPYAEITKLTELLANRDEKIRILEEALVSLS